MGRLVLQDNAPFKNDNNRDKREMNISAPSLLTRNVRSFHKADQDLDCYEAQRKLVLIVNYVHAS